MRNPFLLILIACISFGFFHVSTSGIIFKKDESADAIVVTKKSRAGCSPDLGALNLGKAANEIPLLDGWGKYRMPVTSSHDSAYIYFQQGINMYYGFHIIEALASFEKALSFDEKFAMGYWGKALAYGPNINDVGYAASPEALNAVQKAKSYSAGLTPVEKALVSAISVRYSADSTQARAALDQQYADAMKKVHTEFPASADAAALYADALMVQHPWDLYDRNYNPKPWTPEIVKVLEGLVAKFPENPGANHYYIHAIEGSKNPQKAIAVADRLGIFMPGVSHLVHMPSHIYIRSGQYEKGAQVNTDAVNGYKNYALKFPMVSNNSFLYVVHNLHMQAACANLAGQYKLAVQYSFDTQQSVDSTWLVADGYWGMYSQFVHMTPFFTWVRFGKWDEITKANPVSDSLVYANIMWRWARGMAYSRRHQLSDAKDELRLIQQKKSNPQLMESPTAFNPGLAAIKVAEKILHGAIAEEEQQLDIAIQQFRAAVEKEDGMLYNEPKDWLLPARHYLGAALLKARKYQDAEKIYREDLLINPKNGWSLTGLLESLQRQNKTKEARVVQAQLKDAFAKNDNPVSRSAF